MQHEIDHLDGKLCVDYISPIRAPEDSHQTGKTASQARIVAFI
ncbi:MAG: peptide deformylase [Porticoccaceae bacterium]